jgi:hypothetical protein
MYTIVTNLFTGLQLSLNDQVKTQHNLFLESTKYNPKPNMVLVKETLPPDRRRELSTKDPLSSPELPFIPKVLLLHIVKVFYS